MTAYFLSVFFSTFVLEDVALASCIALIAKGNLTFTAGLLSCFLGIAVGDLILYLFGFLASKFKIENHFHFLKKYRHAFTRLKRSDFFTYSIVISRMIPGTRLPTYLGAGYLRYSFFRFFVLTVLSVFAWVLIALLAGRSLHAIFMDHWVYIVLTFLLGLQILKTVLPKLLDPWDRKTFFNSWRKWTRFEFWPSWFFYIPIVPYYVYLSFKYKSVFIPFYACPELTNGGLIGESKWDFLQYLNPKDATTLPTLKIEKDADFTTTQKILESTKTFYPFILKPDVGQRGFGVRIIRNDYDLTEYLLLSDFEKIIQKLSDLPREAGLFYVRLPSEKMGRIFSITDKKFPFVVGDGRLRLGDLILKDDRAKIIAPVYFSRHRAELDTVIDHHQRYYLSECGNHCQGAIFLNGNDFITEALTKKLDEIAKKIPNFYFGRFDVRYENSETLKNGMGFEIVEINGAGSEATHIWDPNTKILDAYRVLFQQWNLLFEIGNQVKEKSGKDHKINLIGFLKECIKVFFRKDNLTVSS